MAGEARERDHERLVTVGKYTRDQLENWFAGTTETELSGAGAES